MFRIPAVFALLFAAPALAQQVDCVSPVTQYEVNVCAGEAAKAADAELNRLWKVVKPRADARGQGQALLEQQRAWLRYRDATCDAEYESYGGGSMAPAAYGWCIEKMTLARNDELRAMR